MLQCDPRNRSTYNAGTLKLQKRFSDGYQFLVSYTYGKSLDYGSSAASGGGAVGNGQTITNMDAWHGPSGFDVRHRAVISYVYELPFGNRPALDDRGRGLAQGLVGGWQLSGITTMTTGGRSVSRSRRASTTGRRAGPTGLDPASSTTRPSTSGSTRPTSSHRRRTRTAMPAAASCTAGAHNFDTSLSKRVAVGGGSNVEFRWDVFNLFNHPGFGFPNPPLATRLRPHHVDVVDNRSMQFALNLNF